MGRNKYNFKNILVVAPHPDDDAIGCGALLLHLAKTQPDTSITIAYAVSGHNGVTDRFAGTSDPSVKTEIRKQEAIACCTYLRAKPIFWQLPFYEQREKNFTDNDLTIIEQSIQDISPDTIFIIDETSDPHGTHAIVRQLVLQALQNTSFTGKIFGYRVWDPVYAGEQCGLKLFFDESMMTEKIKLISLYKSQMTDPAFPHEHHSFIDLVQKNNRIVAQQCRAGEMYGECYRELSARLFSP